MRTQKYAYIKRKPFLYLVFVSNELVGRRDGSFVRGVAGFVARYRSPLLAASYLNEDGGWEQFESFSEKPTFKWNEPFGLDYAFSDLLHLAKLDERLLVRERVRNFFWADFRPWRWVMRGRSWRLRVPGEGPS